MEGARVMTRGFGDLVAKLGDKVVMEVLVRCWSDGDMVVLILMLRVLNESVDLTGNEDPTEEDGDIGMGDSTGVSASLGGKIFLGGKKCRESNIGDSDNTGDGGKIIGRVIGACGRIVMRGVSRGRLGNSPVKPGYSQENM
ncbi:hypothetical protein Tco_0278417 [Tanacetum coccineum]